MIYSHLKRNKIFNFFCIIILLFCVSSCGFRSKDPAYIYNKKFLKKHEKDIAKKRDKHKKIASENNIFYGYKSAPDDDINSIKLRNELNAKFLEQYREKEAVDEITKNIDVSYLEDNHGEYTKLISVDRPVVDKYSYFNRDTYMNKNFNYIHYDVVQTSYDYIYLIRQAQNKKYKLDAEINNLNEIETQKPKKNGVFDIDNIKERFKNLFKKDK